MIKQLDWQFDSLSNDSEPFQNLSLNRLNILLQSFENTHKQLIYIK